MGCFNCCRSVLVNYISLSVARCLMVLILNKARKEKFLVTICDEKLGRKLHNGLDEGILQANQRMHVRILVRFTYFELTNADSSR